MYLHVPFQFLNSTSFYPINYFKLESLGTHFPVQLMHLPVYPLILVVCFGTALTIALPQQAPNSGQNPQDPFYLYSQIPQEKWPRYKGAVIDPQCILTDLRKNHQKREWPIIPKPVYPAPGYCPAWPQNTETNTETETETDRENRELCGDGFQPRCCTGPEFGFGLGTMNSPCYQCTPDNMSNLLLRVSGRRPYLITKIM